MNEQNRLENEIYERTLGERSEKYTCLFRVDLAGNRILSYRLSDYFESRYGQRLQQNPDYRQMMLGYVLEHVDKNEQERLIQSLLPERLNALLRTRDGMVSRFHETREGVRLCHNAKIRRVSPDSNEVVVGIITRVEEVAAASEYRIGSNRILLVGEQNPETDKLAEILSRQFTVQRAAPQEAGPLLSSRCGEITAILANLPAEPLQALLQLLKNNHRFREIPLLAAAAPETEEACMAMGAADVISAAASPSVICSRVAHTVRLRDSAAMLELLEKDSLTGLYNREFFYRYAREVLDGRGEKEYHLVCFSVENYQMHCEKYGNAVGDLILTHVVEQMRNHLPGFAVGGRLADDVFAVLRENVPFGSHDAVLEAVRRGAPVPNLVVKAGVVQAEGNQPIKLLCDHALEAVAKIRQVYGVHVAEYNDAMRMEKQKEQTILGSMEMALERHQFQVYYQPKHLTSTGRPGGAEALVRWIHPELGFLNPGEFIPLFERIGFIRGLDRYILAQVCADLARWKAMGLPLVPVSVNLSRRDFDSGDLADWILNLTARMGIDRSLLHLEVTETAFSDNPQQISDCISKLHRAGFVIELDDFGSGYSSLTTLNSMDLDVLKIDMSIIRQDIPGSERSVLEFCMELAKMMGLQTVAEGVETEAQRARMDSLGCDYIQGYFYSSPLPVSEFEQYLRRYENV